MIADVITDSFASGVYLPVTPSGGPAEVQFQGQTPVGSPTIDASFIQGTAQSSTVLSSNALLFLGAVIVLFVLVGRRRR